MAPDGMKRGRGRPRKEVSEKLISELAGIGCTTAEIAAVAECSSDTLERNYAAIIQKGRELGRRSLRRMQWGLAERGNVGMLIWLGKQLLSQKEPPREDDMGQRLQVGTMIVAVGDKAEFIQAMRQAREQVKLIAHSNGADAA